MTTDPIAFPGRRFQLWAYTVSHRQLLLRSNKSDQHASRCEILFANVIHIDLPISVEDVEVRIATDEELESRGIARPNEPHIQRTVYIVQGRNVSGYVIAGAVYQAEDDGEYDSPSSLYSLREER